MLWNFGVSVGVSVSSGVILGSLACVVLMIHSLVAAWSRVILGFVSVANYCSVRGCVICGFFGGVLECLGVVARFSVGCGVVN